MAAKKLSKPLAWIGSITAVFSLIAGVYGGWMFVSGQFEKHRAIERLLAAEAVQLGTRDYSLAWKTLEQASTVDPASTQVQQAQEDVATQWLENIHVSGKETFSEIAEKLEPVLTHGTASAKSRQRQADLLAHLGWSYFLRRRESPSGPDPEAAYREALQKDPANPYANAMWGHWILWNHQGSAKASQQFAAALASRPNLRPYVRKLQLSALVNDRSPESLEEVIRVANDIRKEQGDLDPRWADSILTIYAGGMVPPDDHTAAFLNAVPPPEHLATFDWLVGKAGPDNTGGLTRAYLRSALLEAAGRRDEALAGYRALQTRFTPVRSGSLVDATRQAIARLTGGK